MQSNTQSEVSDERIDQHIDNIENTFDKFKISEPNQYNLCDDGGYSIKYGIVQKDVEKVHPDFFIHDEGCTANLYCEVIHNKKIMESSKIINSQINIHDGLL